MKSIAFLSAVMIAIAPMSAFAGRPPSAARIVAEEVGHAGPACGITEATATSAIRAAMRYNRMTEDTTATGGTVSKVPTVYFSGSVGKVGVTCVGNYQIQFLIWVPMPSPWATGERILGKALFCQKGGFNGGSTATFSTNYLNGVKDAFNDCLSQMADRTVASR